MKKKLLIVAIFLLGAMAGYSLAMLRLELKKIGRMESRDTEAVHAGVNKLDAKLKLSAGQKRSLHKILRHRREDVANLKKELRPKYLAIRKDLENEIHSVLTPEQQRNFRAMTRQAETREGWLKDSQNAVLTSGPGDCASSECREATATETSAQTEQETDKES